MRGRLLLLTLALASGPLAAGAGDEEGEFVLNPSAIDDLTAAEITACNGLIHWSPTLRPAPEPVALAANPSVRRAGKRLRLGKATFITRTVAPEADDGEEYVFVGRYRAAPLMLVSVFKYESHAWRLVDPATGAHADAASLPLPGPGGRAFASPTRSDGYNEPGLEITEWRNGRFSGVALEAAYPCDLVWRSSDELSFRLRVGETAEWRPARAIRKDGVWSIEGP